MDNKFTKLEDLTEIKLNLVDLETAKTQLKSMKIGYIKTAFVLKDMEQEYNRLHELNLKDYDAEVLDRAEVHALKQIENPNYYSGEVMKTVSKEIAQCFQALLMLKNKKEEIEAHRSEMEIVEKNIKWLRKLAGDLAKK
jgi:hypothetical protein